VQQFLIDFVGVWDTVASIGLRNHRITHPSISFNRSINVARQALALDERRADFRPVPWYLNSINGGKFDLNQVWFAGCHSDVGGGYQERESGLSKIALRWMVHEAANYGLLINRAAYSEIMGESKGSVYCAPDPNGMLHRSLSGWWHLAELYPDRVLDTASMRTAMRLPLYRTRTVPTPAMIHKSVLDRTIGDYNKRLPADALYVDDLLLPT
jgi:uncharacterized protein (DUF2235 family)